MTHTWIWIWSADIQKSYIKAHIFALLTHCWVLEDIFIIIIIVIIIIIIIIIIIFCKLICSQKKIWNH